MSRIINFLVKDIVPPLAFVMFVFGGVMMLISAGNENRRKTGISILNSTLVGLLIVLGAWVILNTILRTITVGGLDYAFWKNATCQ